MRYSTSPIDASNWDAATQVDGEPVPASPGDAERFEVAGLDADTEYYFAVRTADWAEPSNLSAVSNNATCTTSPLVPPLVLRNPWIANDRVADCRTPATIGATFGNAYTPDGVVPPANDQDKAINIYNNLKRRLYHWKNMPPDASDLLANMNVFGWALCGTQQRLATRTCQAVGMEARSISVPGHNFYSVQYYGAWHAMDTMTTMYVYNRATPRTIASGAEIKADHSIMLDAEAEGRACPGFLLCGDTASWFADVIDSYQTGAAVGQADHSMDMNLTLGESLERTWESWPNQYPSAGQPPYHHEASRDYQDYVNYPYWEPYAVYGLNGYSVTYRRWANGTDVIEPDFRSAAYKPLIDSSSNIATFDDDGLTPDLHAANPGTEAEVVFHVQTPFFVTSVNVSGDFCRKTANDSVSIYWSVNNVVWKPAWEMTSVGTTHLDSLSIGDVTQRYDYYLKFIIDASEATTDAGLSNLVINTTIEHNKGGMPYLDKGANHITVTCDNPEDLGTAATFRVVYKWKEYDGAGWTIDCMHEQYITESPTSYTIDVGGTKVPRTESILMEVMPALPHGSNPAPISDLRASHVDSNEVTLTWTATGDDWNVGQADAYDLRYSTLPITPANWSAATVIAEVPSPQPVGASETFTVPGLEPETTYYFAIVASDQAGNQSDLSNVCQATTALPDLTPPAAVADLAAVDNGDNNALVSWTATGDDGTAGQASSYDLRYNPAAEGEITEANWDQATPVPGLAAPQASGTAESVLVTGLATQRSYYFALKVNDEAGNTSALSNIAFVLLKAGPRTVLLEPAKDGPMYGIAVADGNSNRGYGGRFDLNGADSSAVNSVLLQFDLTDIVDSSEQIVGATLDLYPPKTVGTASYNMELRAYPLLFDWVEGVGTTDGVIGSTDSPWGPATVGDAVYNYREVTAVGVDSSWGVVAADGVPWDVPGARGIGTDVSDDLMISQNLSGTGYFLDQKLCSLDFTAAGVRVLNQWATGARANYGLSLFPLNGAIGSVCVATREYPTIAWHPQLVLSIAPADLPPAVIGDINSDGYVNVGDLQQLGGGLGQPGRSAWQQLECRCRPRRRRRCQHCRSADPRVPLGRECQLTPTGSSGSYTHPKGTGRLTGALVLGAPGTAR